MSLQSKAADFAHLAVITNEFVLAQFDRFLCIILEEILLYYLVMMLLLFVMYDVLLYYLCPSFMLNSM